MHTQDAVDLQLRLKDTFEEAIERVTEALSTEGFGILTRIDMHRAFKEKLGIPFHSFTILGACNPGLAYRAITLEPRAGLLLPCNVTVEETPEGGSEVRFADPTEMMVGGPLGSNEGLEEVAREARERLLRVSAILDNPEGSVQPISDHEHLR